MSRSHRWITNAGLTMAAATVTTMLGVVAPLRAITSGAQETGVGASEPGPLERQAVVPTLDAPAPRRVVNVEPLPPQPPYGFRFRVHLVVDRDGRVAEARIPRTFPGTVPDGELLRAWSSAGSSVLEAVRQWQFEPPLRAPMLLMTDVVVGERTGEVPIVPTPSSGTDARAAARQPLRVGGTIGPPRKVVDVPPVYPQAAKDAQVSGVVIVEATIDTEGAVEAARIVRSIPLLDAAALDAVKQWRYTPTLLNGEVVPVIMTVTINFSLQ